MQHSISISLILIAIWLANSGHYGPLMLSFGLLSVLLVVWISHRMDVVDHESQPVHMTRKLPGYYYWLGKNIIASNLDVVKRIWSPKLKLSPTVALLPTPQHTEVGKVIYANSINLTPGTLSIELEDGQVLVHALVEDYITELRGGEMARRVCALED